MTTVDTHVNKDINFIPVEYVDSQLGITVRELDGGIRLFEMSIGTLGRVEVLDIPGAVITPDQWAIITKAKESYGKVWGGINAIKKIEEDAFEGKPPNDRKYLTNHQIAIFSSPDGSEDIVTNREVRLNPNASPTPPLYDDIVFWQAVNTLTQERVPLEKLIKQYVQANYRDLDTTRPELNISAISRTGRYPYVIRDKNEADHDKVAIAWAMMQIAVTYRDTSAVYACMLCPEFQNNVLTIRQKTDNDDSTVKLDFVKTAKVLNLGPEWELDVDRTNDYVKSTIFEFPGYWLDGNLRVLFEEFVDQGKLGAEDFKTAALALLESEEKILLKDSAVDLLNTLVADGISERSDLSDIVKLLTTPRYCKYLIPLINEKEKINENLTGDQLRDAILERVKIRAFSSLLDRTRWEESIKSLLRAAKNKYNE